MNRLNRRNLAHIGSISCAVVLCTSVSLAVAQPLPARPGAIEPGFGAKVGRGFSGFGDDFEEPSFELNEQGEKPGNTQVLPPLPSQTPMDEAAGAIGDPVTASEIVITGNTVIPQSQIEQIVAPFLDRELLPEHIQELRKRLSLQYLNAGYINSGVIYPPVVNNGVLTFQAVEGKLKDIELRDTQRISQTYLEPRVRRSIATPLNINQLQSSLRKLELDPMIRQINGALVPGINLGEADLRLRVKEANPVRIGLAVDNYRSPSIAAEGGVLSLEHLNLTGRGDHIALYVSASKGLDDAYISYRTPLNTYDTRLNLYYQTGDSKIVESPFEDLDIEGDSESWGANFTHPVINRLNRTFVISTGLDQRSNKTTLLGRPFSFSLGARNGESVATSATLGAEWIERRDDQVFAVRTTVRYGLDLFGATMIPDGAPDTQPTINAKIPESKFTVLLTQLQYARRIDYRNSQLVFNTVWQESFDPLLAVEKLSIGGAYSVRGFRENQLVRDNGISASLEWRVPMFANDAGYSRWNLTAIPFLDYGRSWDEDSNLSTHTPANISSIGIGFRWLPIEDLVVDVAYGYRLSEEDVPEPEEKDLQDRGFHFAVRFSRSF
ncbi:MAG: two-partner secretion system transporter CdrB [Halioglobus sp.]